MTRNQRTLSWFNIIEPLNYVTGAAMVAAAAYLIRPSLLDLGLYVEARRYELVSLFLIYAAIVLVTATLRRGRGTTTWGGEILAQLLYGPGPLLGIALVEGVLAGKALFAEPPKWWVVAFAIPALLTLATMVDSDVQSTKRARAASGDDESDDDTTDADTGKTSAGGYILGFLISGVASAVVMLPFFLLLALGFAFYYSLDAVIFAGEDRGLRWFIDAVPKVLGNALPRILPALFAIMVVLPLLGVIFAVVNWLTKLGRKNVDRDLSPAEIAFIERAHEAVRAYVAARGYRGKGIAIAAVLIPLLVAIIGPMMLLMIYEDSIVAAFYEPQHVRGLGWYIYVDDMGAASIMVLFASIFSFWSLMYLVYHAWPVLAERLAATSAETSLHDRLVDAVRRGDLKIDRAFEPGRFLRDSSLMYESLVYFATGVIVLVTAVLWYHDRADYDLIAENSILAGDYWTLKPMRFSYADVRRVEIECWVNDKGNLDIGYDILLPSNRSVQMIQPKHLHERFDKYAAVDEKLRALGKPVAFDERKPLVKAAFIAYDPDCVHRLAEDRDIPREKVERLFHLDDWYHRQWQQRTAPQ